MAQQNRLLAALPSDASQRLSRHMQIVSLSHGQILHRPNEFIREVYFPLDCLILVTVTMIEARTAEAGVVGSQEMVGVNAFMGGRATNQTTYICQSAGSAVKIPAEPFLDEF